jgi:hypothetical protein
MAKKRDIKAQGKADLAKAKAQTKKDSPPPAPLKVVSTSATGGVFVDHFVPNAT